jgi:predicted nuclease of predicted toxin-antitoxin system
MKFKLDENLPGEIAGDLRAAGHDAQTVADEGLCGAPDSTLLRKAREEERTLLTLDKGIAGIRAYSPADYPGLVLFRPDSLGRGRVLAFVRG